MENPRIGIVISTTREGRFADRPTEWFYGLASERDDMEFEVVDLRDYPLPFYGESRPGEAGERWSEKMDELDGYVFVTAEYNHSITGVLKNALDYLGPEIEKKPAAFVAYGGVGGARAVQQLRIILLELGVVPVNTAVHIGTEPMGSVGKGRKSLADYDFLNESAEATLDKLAWWTRTLKAGRESVVAMER